MQQIKQNKVKGVIKEKIKLVPFKTLSKKLDSIQIKS